MGAVAPETSAAPAVLQGVWGCALTVRSAHLVANGAAQDVHVGRLVGFTVDGWWALVGPESLVEAADEDMPKCLGCATMLKQMGPRVVVVSP